MRLLVSGLGRTVLEFIYYMFNSTLKNNRLTHSHKIVIVRSIREFSTVSSTNNFRHPKLREEELRNGCKLRLDTWADTDCSGKHTYMEEFLIGKTLTAMGFSSSLGKLKNLAYAHVLYAYDHEDGSVLLLKHNNTIYLGDAMQGSLSNPIQSEENGIRIDLRPRHNYDENCQAQTITFPNLVVLPILHEGVLPYIPSRRLTSFEIENSTRLELTSRDDWDPYHLQNWLVTIDTHPSSHTLHTDADPISIELMSCRMSKKAISHQLLHTICDSKINVNQECNFSTIKWVTFRESDSSTPEQLSVMWHIGLKTAKNTILATRHKCIRSTGMLTRIFKMEKSQLGSSPVIMAHSMLIS